ncbi:hypothetical protein JGK42_001708 [Aeromonas veronii]|nr:hypothetical protein [Aeromonas veronii]
MSIFMLCDNAQKARFQVFPFASSINQLMRKFQDLPPFLPIFWECALKGRLRHDPERQLLVISWWLTNGINHGEIAGGYELKIAP